MKRPKLLLTGARGFIGSAVLGLLREQNIFEVHCVSTIMVLPFAGEIWHQANLLDETDIKQLIEKVSPTHLLHLAWQTEHGKFWNSLENAAWEANTLSLVNYFTRFGGSRAIFAGTMAEYNWKIPVCNDQIANEAPSSEYGRRKLNTLRSIECFARNNSLSFAWGRIFLPYGPAEHPNRFVASIISKLLARSPCPMTTGEQARDLLYVLDIAEGFVALINGTTEGVVNICSGQAVRLRDVALAIAELVGAPIDLIGFGQVKDSVDSPALLVGTNDRLRNEAGWCQKYSLEKGLEKSIRFYQNLESSRRKIASRAPPLL